MTTKAERDTFIPELYTGEACWNCQLFKPEAKGVVPWGWCRSRPPAMLVTGVENSPSSFWPRVEYGDWCGEWTKRK